MARRSEIDDFLAQRVLAAAGVSRDGKGFGAAAVRELRAKGYTVHVIHPEAASFDGLPCFAGPSDLPEDAGGLLVVLPPPDAEKAVRAAAAAGIPRVWLQQGSGSPAVRRACAELGLSAVHDECILMYAEPAAFIHRFHRGLWKLLGKAPD